MGNNINFHMSRLEYDSDCDMLDICKKLSGTYGRCYKGASFVTERCTPAEKQAIFQRYEQNKTQLEIQNREDERQRREERLQTLRDKKAVRRSWVQLLIAALLGGLFTKLIDFIPAVVNWLKALQQ